MRHPHLVLDPLRQSGGGAVSLRLDSLLPTDAVHVGSARIPQYAFVLLGLAVVLTIVLSLVFRLTRFGLATRAGAATAAPPPERETCDTSGTGCR